MEKKSLYDISLKITEEEYRADPALSYSTLATFERKGIDNIEHLFDKKESPSLTFGSCVDSIITGGFEEFNSKFIVADFPKISDVLVLIIKKLFNEFSTTHNMLDSIPNIEISRVAKSYGFWVADKWDNRRVTEVKKEEGCHEYYKLLYIAKDKTIITTDTYNDVINSVNALKNDDTIGFYFADNTDDDIERFYQLKFKSTLNNIDYRIMADLIVVDHNNKTIIPVDLKTSSHEEKDFYKSFIDWNYQIQARLYHRVIRDNLDKDDYFKDFKLENYKFIVINKKTLCPLVWDFEDAAKRGTLIYGNHKQILMSDPEDIGEILTRALSGEMINNNIIMNENDIIDWLNTY